MRKQLRGHTTGTGGNTSEVMEMVKNTRAVTLKWETFEPRFKRNGKIINRK